MVQRYWILTALAEAVASSFLCSRLRVLVPTAVKFCLEKDICRYPGEERSKSFHCEVVVTFSRKHKLMLDVDVESTNGERASPFVVSPRLGFGCTRHL